MTGERENEIRELMLRLPIGDARKAISHLLLEVEDARAENAALREGFGMMLKRFGTCLSVIAPSGGTAEMAMARCHRCDPCLAREIWENRCK